MRRSSPTLGLHVHIETWQRDSPLRITGYCFDSVEVVVVKLEKDGYVGRGEGGGVYYRDDWPSSMVKEIESLRPEIESGISRESLRKLLPPGGARNALDCALWDLEAKLCGRAAWQMAGIEVPRPLLTTFTCGAEEPGAMAACARQHPTARAIKLKLTGEEVDADRVEAVRQARPDVWLGVDANQGFSRSFLDHLMPVLVATRVQLIEQPFRVGEEKLLEGYQSPIPIAADESVQSFSDISGLVGRFNVVNIKLDKCGGLTEALAMVQAARSLGLSPMVGCMMGTSLAMAPAVVVGQLCDIIDLDGPVNLVSDREPSAQYIDGFVSCPKDLWGSR